MHVYFESFRISTQMAGREVEATFGVTETKHSDELGRDYDTHIADVKITLSVHLDHNTSIKSNDVVARKRLAEMLRGAAEGVEATIKQ